MSISYDPLWQMLAELNITKMELAKMIGISNATLAKLSKNEPITLTTVDKICNRFDCKIENVVRHIPELKINKAKFIVEKGMIVLSEDTSLRIKTEGTSLFRYHKRPHVVLDVLSSDRDTNPQKIANTKYDDLIYAVAPIYTNLNTSSPLDVSINGVEIDGIVTDGIVSFGKLTLMDSGLLEKKLGIMPDKYMGKFEKILRALDIDEVLDEDENDVYHI